MLKFLLVVILLAVAVYLVVRVIQRRGIAPTPRRSAAPDPRPFGPDDDPDFLRDLDRRHKNPEDPDA